MVVSLRAVRTIDFMAARRARLPYEFLDRVSYRIINEVAGISWVVYEEVIPAALDLDIDAPQAILWVIRMSGSCAIACCDFAHYLHGDMAQIVNVYSAGAIVYNYLI